MKKTIVFMSASAFLLGAVVLPMANAQTAAGTSVGATGYGYATPAQVVSPAMPIAPPPVDAGFLQFNNLTVESVSGTNVPAEILASNPSVYPMMGAASGGGASVGGAPTAMPITPPNAPSAAAAPSAASAPSSVTCLRFSTQDSAMGQVVACPTPAVAPSTSTAPIPTTAPTPPGAAGSANAGVNIATPAPYPPTYYPIRYQPYRIEIDASTHLLLNDRTVATLSSFSSGDQINVFGYYNTDGSIQAYLVRDLSKPAQDQFIQLNNVVLASISANTVPTTLVVTQAQGYPCYGFGVSGAAKQSIACPMGVSAASNNPAIQNLTVPSALAPTWMMLRKYVVTVDAGTIILDNNRTGLSLSDLRVGDQLNVYGDTKDNGQTLNADIVRDISIPATPSSYNGTITQVNADGSFVVQTSNGQTITVQSPIQVGATVQLSGLLDRLKNVLSQVSNMNFGGTAIYNIPPMVGGTTNVQN